MQQVNRQEIIDTEITRLNTEKEIPRPNRRKRNPINRDETEKGKEEKTKPAQRQISLKRTDCRDLSWSSFYRQGKTDFLEIPSPDRVETMNLQVTMIKDVTERIINCKIELVGIVKYAQEIHAVR